MYTSVKIRVQMNSNVTKLGCDTSPPGLNRTHLGSFYGEWWQKLGNKKLLPLVCENDRSLFLSISIVNGANYLIKNLLEIDSLPQMPQIRNLLEMSRLTPQG
jgi:hypothetical protein